MMMFETSKHVPKTEKRCCVFENNHSQLNLNKFVGSVLIILLLFELVTLGRKNASL